MESIRDLYLPLNRPCVTRLNCSPSLEEFMTSLTKVGIIMSVFLSAFPLIGCAPTEKLPPGDLKDPNWLYLESNSTTGVILCHGNGGNPDGYVVSPLRKGIHKELGFHTLSIEMPSAGNRKRLAKFRDDFSEAYKYIKAGIDYLRHKKGVQRIYLIGHSMGSRMATSYLKEHPMVSISGFIGVGMLNNGGAPFDCKSNLKNVSIPVLDVYGEYGNFNDADAAQDRMELISEKYTQKVIAGGDHSLTHSEAELLEIVVDWLTKEGS